ncbi:hypothetical protein NKR19_g5422 [Coniochaeta hoffmannii]|uniref:C2H2-type domain-containing protein n=1 Tax=Coniochaeta hoffmannii TaxID=91930 RepID=A0AA38RXC8_9PEZI|nr:hypothetical protein NKR19_g5422 [Coniochaeta hoffmannii]
MPPFSNKHAVLGNPTAKPSQKRKLSLREAVERHNSKRRRSYPVEESRAQVLESQRTKRRHTEPVASHRVRISKRNSWGYDVAKNQSSQRRRLSLLKYHKGQDDKPRQAARDTTYKETESFSYQENIGETSTVEVYGCSQCPKVFDDAGKLDLHVIRDHGNFLSFLGHEPEKLIVQKPSREKSQPREKSQSPGKPQTQQPKRKLSVVVIEDDDEEAPKPKRKRRVSVIVLDDDDNDDDPQVKKPTRKEHITVDGTPSPPRKRKQSPKKQVKSLKPTKEAGHEVLRCANCPEKFDTMALKQEHLATDHADEFAKLNARCWQCNFRFRSIRDLNDHVQAMHTERGLPDDGPKKPIRVNCFVCDQEVAKSTLRHHVKNQHPRAWQQNLKLEQMQKRYCPVCQGLINAAQRNLKAHIRNVHPELWNRNLSEEEMLVPEKKIRTKWAVCTVCQERYVADKLDKHMELRHPPAEEE